MFTYSLVCSHIVGRYCVYVPTVVHPPLMSSRDDIFFRICAMNSIAFNYETKTGILFFLVDSIVSGALSCLIISDTRSKAIECAIHTLTFILKNFGKDDVSDTVIEWTCLTSVLQNLKAIHRRERALMRGITILESKVNG